MTAKVANRGTD